MGRVQRMTEYRWPYENEFGKRETVFSDVLVLGGGLAGCFAAIAAGTGFDHWESACTNPCSKVTPEEIANAYVDEQDHFSNGIAHYIECYDRLLDLERFGG